MLKMKKFMITGMVFLTAMTVLAGCGNATETTTTEEISTADENQEISVSSGGNLTIPVDELTENAAFYSVNVDGTEMEVMAVKTSDGTIRTAFNTCQICYDSGNGYYKQEGDKLVCQNCGNSFAMDQVGETAGGCNPYPILDDDKTATEDEIQISYEFLKESSDIFANWKRK